ncbi:MAG TPA: alpha-L-fucosidase, partial [Bacteroidota bacterium]|nr:alpha-L-fucosidase [Bacteroidota bacterium]
MATGRHRAALAIGLIVACGRLQAQAPREERETDPLVLKKLEWFRDQKFGLILHWGTYAQWGIVESWSICSEDEPWCTRPIDDYCEYCRRYEALQKTFNPVRFDPDAWAAAAREAGMRYVVFTTKHHDGFCMFDTKETPYRITDTACPFHTSPRANVALEVFNAFRRNNLGIGAYFSKPDWHSPYYWNPRWAHADRNVNYSIAKHPDLWRSFQSYTFNQIRELMTGYGSIDILWLDGGWVNPGNLSQDIRMDTIATMARSHQPGLIIVDRAVHGRYEDYRTPEQEVPDTPPDYTWETCMTMGHSWSYDPHDTYKSARTLVHTLVNIVAKGGNLLLGIGPDASGELPAESVKRLKDIGAWLSVNGKAIYATRAIPPYVDGNFRFTREAGGAIDAIYLPAEGEEAPPARMTIHAFSPAAGSAVTLVGTPGNVAWQAGPAGVMIDLTEAQRGHLPCAYAWTFRIERP